MQESGQITEEVFSSMLASYLSQIGDVKKTARKKKQPQVVNKKKINQHSRD